MRDLYIMRGVPGAGKSTQVEKCIATLENHEIGVDYIVCSADHYHMVNGEYKYNPEYAGMAHARCIAKANAAMQLEYQCVIIDNTNTRWEHILPYIVLAIAHGYAIIVIDLHVNDNGGVPSLDNLELYTNRNTHGVPMSEIKRMIEDYTPSTEILRKCTQLEDADVIVRRQQFKEC